jgi:hypothetical protein
MAADITPRVTIKGRSYKFFASGGETLFRVNDTATPYLAMLAQTFGPEMNKALASLGWTLRNKMRESMRAGGPPGATWPKHVGIGKLHAQIGDRARSTRSANPHAGLFGHLYQAIGYRRDKANMRVQIGFLSSRSSALAMKLQEGFETRVTQKMRRLYNARGLKLSGKGSIVTPPRPLVGPVFRAVESQIPTYLEGKISEYLLKKRMKAA